MQVAFDAAVADAAAKKRLLLVIPSAEWCKPCKRFKATTMVAPEVQAWFADHGAVFTFDTDAEPALTTTLQAHTLPTLIVYVDGEEVDRSAGDRPPAALLTWLADARAGLTLLGALAERIVHGGAAFDIGLRLDYAEALIEANRFAEATNEYAWLWENIPRYAPQRLSTRDSFGLQTMARLAAQYPPAAVVFADLIGMSGSVRRRFDRQLRHFREHAH